MQPGLISRVISEKAKQEEDKKTSDFLVQLIKALRAILKSKNYTLDASSLLKMIDKHPEPSHRTLDLLCPTSDYQTLAMLFNYKQVLNHVERYIKEQYYGDVERLNGHRSRTTIEKDMRLLINRIKKFLGDEVEIKYWGRKVNWDKNVRISVPRVTTQGNTLNGGLEQRNYSLEEESSLIILDNNNRVLQIVLQVVLDTGTACRRLFTIELNPKQESYEEMVRIYLHRYPSKVGHGLQQQSKSSEIPIQVENGSKGLCVYLVTQSSVARGTNLRRYLNFQLNDKGQQKKFSFERRICKIRSDPSLSNEERNEKVRRYENMRTRVINKRQYQILTVRTKGLLLYSLIESDHKEFNEVIENISKCNRDDVEDFDPYYDEKIWIPF